MKIIETIYQSYMENNKTKSPEPAYENCETIFESLMDILETTERKQLLALSDEYTFLNCFAHEQGFTDGFVFAISMIFESVTTPCHSERSEESL